MRINLTLPGLGNGAKKQKAQEPMPMVKKRYWTPGSGDKDAFDYPEVANADTPLSGGNPNAFRAGTGTVQGPEGSGYVQGDPWYDKRAWDKKTGKWVKITDDIYRTDKETGEQLLWQPPQTPQKKGLMK